MTGASVRTGVPPGDIEALRDSGFFDVSWYLHQFADVALLAMDPVEHYLWIGARLGRNPSPAFDGNAYLASNDDVARSGVNPLLHYIRHGRDEGRSWSADGRRHAPDEVSTKAYIPTLPADLEAEILRLPILRSSDAAVDVIVPVYRARTETLSCLWHILKSTNRTAHQVVVIDDCSPEPDLSASLDRIAAAGHIQLLRNERNLGFVKTVNRGMRLHEDRDVILLNSDTEVYGDWIDRLRAVADRDAGCGTVTPLTNNGTVCSYPLFNRENNGTLELSFDELDGLARVVNRGQVVETPTAVGFCMYIKRNLIRQIGYFDDVAFGRGYGEENDFCLRSQKAGWRDLIATDTFVRHLGSVSFQGEKAELARNNLKILEQKHPGYGQRVQAYIRRDPAAALRARIDLARLARLKRDRNLLVVSHTRGGGVERCVKDSIASLSGNDTTVFLMRRVQATSLVTHLHPDVAQVPNLPQLDIDADAGEIVRIWDELSISEVHVHHWIDFGASGANRLSSLLRRSGRPYRVTVHDYFPICPRISLHDEAGYYCGEPGDSGCNACLKTRGEALGVVDIAAWRKQHGTLLGGASRVIVPNEDVAERLHRYFPSLRVEVVKHEQDLQIRRSVRRATAGPRLRVGVLGGISDIKGFGVLVECAKDARKLGLPLDFVVIGHTKNDVMAREAGIDVTGPYLDARLQQEIAAANLGAIFLPSTWPETYSYTLSAALQTDLPVVVFDIGAPARRVRGVTGTVALPLELARKPRALNAKLLGLLRDERVPHAC